jgi:methylenetetrahydrofolate reductase (NADPH)
MRSPANLYSFEFFPPKTPEGTAKLRTARAQLAQLKPAFCSVTFGAGGSTREGTLATVIEIRDEGLPAAPHLFVHRGFPRIAARRAHPVSRARHPPPGRLARRTGLPGMADAGEFRYASDLVAFIRAETGDWFHIDVAGYPEYHPQARNPHEDLDNFERKVARGADSAITQYFFNRDAYGTSSMPAPRGLDDSDRAGHHADRELHAPRALLGRVRLPRFRAGSAASSKATATTRLGARVRPRRGDRVVRRPARRRRTRPAFLHAQHGGLTSTIWQRLGL